MLLLILVFCVVHIFTFIFNYFYKNLFTGLNKKFCEILLKLQFFYSPSIKVISLAETST
jgi:hypothetical protein